MEKTILVAGARGFIGFNAMQRWLKQDPTLRIIAVDANTYADQFLLDQKELWEDSTNRVNHYILDLASPKAIYCVKQLCKCFEVDTIVDFHAESHVDNSISNPSLFFNSNVIGTANLLEVARELKLRFHYVSTDEVVGPVSPEEALSGTKIATEDASYAPSSPYSASKAGAEMAVKCYAKTFGLKATISRCTNNFGPWQFPEKLIPLAIKKILAGEKIPVYGNGLQRRFWIYVDQHVDAIKAILDYGIPDGRIYNIAPKPDNLKTNISLLEIIAGTLGKKLDDCIEFVKDRLAHDECYWLESSRMEKETKWVDLGDFKQDMQRTIDWYMEMFI